MTPSRSLRLLIADDADLVAEALAALLETEPGLTVVARVSRGDLVLAAVREHEPDVAVLDVDMPDLSGIEAAGQLAEQGLVCPVVLVTALEGSGHLHRALAAGASAYVLKTAPAARLIDAIWAAAEGRITVDPDLAADALRLGPNPLTPREAQILRLGGTGLTAAAVAAQVHLSKGTVRNYLSSAITKAGAANRTDAYHKAKRAGWL